jgi:hypothetical protein
MARKNRYEDFRALSKDEQRERILSLTSMCHDGAPLMLARWVEIYFDATEDEQKDRMREAYTRS